MPECLRPQTGRNRLIFRAADEADAVQAADFLGKKRVVKRSWGFSAGKRNVNYNEIEEHRITEAFNFKLSLRLLRNPNMAARLFRCGSDTHAGHGPTKLNPIVSAMKYIALIPLVFVASCASRPQVVLRQTPPPPVEPVEAVRYGEVVRAYHVGRYVDPNHPETMHEQHPVYRIEVSARWNLHPGPLNTANLLNPPPDAAFAPPPTLRQFADARWFTASRWRTRQMPREQQTKHESL